MTNFEQTIQKLLRRIARAESKGKTKKVARLNAELQAMAAYQIKHEAEMQQMEDIAFDYENEQSKDFKSESEIESEEELPLNLGNAGSTEEVSNSVDSSTNLPEHGVLESQEREDIDINEEQEQEQEE